MCAETRNSGFFCKRKTANKPTSARVGNTLPEPIVFDDLQWWVIWITRLGFSKRNTFYSISFTKKISEAKVSEISIRITTVVLVLKSNQNFKSNMTWYFVEFWIFLILSSQDLFRRFLYLWHQSVTLIFNTFSENSFLKNEQPKTFAIPTKSLFHSVKKIALGDQFAL